MGHARTSCEFENEFRKWVWRNTVSGRRAGECHTSLPKRSPISTRPQSLALIGKSSMSHVEVKADVFCGGFVIMRIEGRRSRLRLTLSRIADYAMNRIKQLLP